GRTRLSRAAARTFARPAAGSPRGGGTARRWSRGARRAGTARCPGWAHARWRRHAGRSHAGRNAWSAFGRRRTNLAKKLRLSFRLQELLHRRGFREDHGVVIDEVKVHRAGALLEHVHRVNRAKDVIVKPLDGLLA